MQPRDVLVTGSTGMLAQAVIAAFEAAGSNVVAFSKAELDVTDAHAVRSTILDVRPQVVIQGAAFTRVDEAEDQEDLAFAVNAEAVASVANACNRIGARLLYPSTDYVFDGAATQPYSPEHPTHPINAYGRSKAAGELAARSALDHVIVRTSWLYGNGGRNFVSTIVDRLQRDTPVNVVNDQFGAPTWTRDLAAALVELLNAAAPTGVYHVTSGGVTSWFGVAQAIAEALDKPHLVQPTDSAQYLTRARRPRYSVLDHTASAAILGAPRHWRAALEEAIAAHAY